MTAAVTIAIRGVLRIMFAPEENFALETNTEKVQKNSLMQMSSMW